MRPRSRTVTILLSLLALATGAACTREPEQPSTPASSPERQASGQASGQASVKPSLKASEPFASSALRSPKPGERVRQPELDGYCDGDSAVAFYYHGGNPTTRVARNDHCTPLFVSECEAEGRCYPPRDQEPGMWCCAPRSNEITPTAHAAR